MSEDHDLYLQILSDPTPSEQLRQEENEEYLATMRPLVGKKVLIGYCDVDSGQILICDPCYIDGNFEDKKSAISTGLTQPQWLNEGDHVIPDSECEIDGSTYVQYESNSWDFEMDNPDLSYEGCCSVTLNKEVSGQLVHSAGHPGAGVAVSSGYGDGTYPVYAEFIDDGPWGIRTKSVTIEFIGEDEDD